MVSYREKTESMEFATFQLPMNGCILTEQEKVIEYFTYKWTTDAEAAATTVSLQHTTPWLWLRIRLKHYHSPPTMLHNVIDIRSHPDGDPEPDWQC